MSAPAYSPELLARFRDPTHAGSFPAGTPGVATGWAGDAGDGRLVRVQLRVEPGAAIADARFKAFGCPATIACASYLTGELVGRTLEQVARLTPAAIASALDVADDLRAAPELAVAALRDALERASSPA